MRPRGFIEDWRPRQKSLDLLAKVEAIIAEYAMPLTIRQIFYRLVGRHGYDKTEQAYDNLGELLTKARRAQRISMEAIRDDGFVNHHPQCFASAGHFMTAVRKAAESLTLDYQKGQPRRLVVMCEAAGMALPRHRALRHRRDERRRLRQPDRQASAGQELGYQRPTDHCAADRRL